MKTYKPKSFFRALMYISWTIFPSSHSEHHWITVGSKYEKCITWNRMRFVWHLRSLKSLLISFDRRVIVNFWNVGHYPNDRTDNYRSDLVQVRITDFHWSFGDIELSKGGMDYFVPQWCIHCWIKRKREWNTIRITLKITNLPSNKNFFYK